MKTICYILPNLYCGGIPRVLEGLHSYFKKRGFSQVVVLLHKKLPICYEVSGSEIIELCPMRRGYVGKTMAFYQRWRAFAKLRKKHSFDIVVGMGVAANLLNILTRQYGGKTVCTEHNIKSIENSTWGVSGKLYNLLMKKLYNKADVIVALTEDMKKDLSCVYRIDKNKIQVIKNPQRINSIIEKGEEKVPPQYAYLFTEETVSLICLGTIRHAKGHVLLVKALPLLKQRIGNLKCIFMGQPDSAQEELESLVSQLGLEQIVTIIGNQENPYPFLRRASLMLLPSLYEGLGMVLVESMALGTPVIATNCLTGPKDLLCKSPEEIEITNSFLEADYGILVPSWPSEREQPNNINELNTTHHAFIAAIEQMFRPEIYAHYVAVGKERAWEFDETVIGKVYHDLFLSL